jgi:hypothetical protein
MITMRTWVTLADAAAGLMDTVAAPDATVTGPPAPRPALPLVTVALRLPPSHVDGMLLSTTAVTFAPDSVKFVTTLSRLPQAVTGAVPEPSVLVDAIVDCASALEGTTTVTTAHAKPRAMARVRLPNMSPLPISRR